MTSNDTSKRGDSQCRSCKEIFNHSDLKIVQVKHYGLDKEEKVCPYCGSHTYGMIDYPVSEEELIYKNGKFYLHSGKDLKSRLDKVIYYKKY